MKRLWRYLFTILSHPQVLSHMDYIISYLLNKFDNSVTCSVTLHLDTHYYSWKFVTLSVVDIAYVNNTLLVIYFGYHNDIQVTHLTLKSLDTKKMWITISVSIPEPQPSLSTSITCSIPCSKQGMLTLLFKTSWMQKKKLPWIALWNIFSYNSWIWGMS
jgi:hypothetical protein